MKILLITLNIILLLISLLFAEASSPNYDVTRSISMVFLLLSTLVLFKIKIKNKVCKWLLIIFNVIISFNSIYYALLTIYYNIY